MKIAVLTKLVADSSLKEIKTSDDGTKIAEDLNINHFDMYAMEQALLVKSAVGTQEKVEIFSLTLGSEFFKNKIREPLNFGFDKAILIKDDSEEFSELMGTAKLLAEALKKENPNIIFCGAKSLDTGSGLTPILLGKIMGMPVVANIKTFEFNYKTKTAKVSKIEGNNEIVYEVSLPAIFSCEKGLNKPRSSGGMANIIAAKKKPLEIILPTELLPGLKTEKPLLKKYIQPEKRKGGQILKGLTPKQAAEKILEALKNKRS